MVPAAPTAQLGEQSRGAGVPAGLRRGGRKGRVAVGDRDAVGPCGRVHRRVQRLARGVVGGVRVVERVVVLDHDLAEVVGAVADRLQDHAHVGGDLGLHRAELARALVGGRVLAQERVVLPDHEGDEPRLWVGAQVLEGVLELGARVPHVERVRRAVAGAATGDVLAVVGLPPAR